MKKNPWLVILGLFFIAFVVGVFVIGYSIKNAFHVETETVSKKDSILYLKLNGVIVDSKKFLDPLIKYRKDDRIKAIVIEVNSPGGVVGPSQEIYMELKRTKEKFKKPIVVVSTSLNASGGYYSSVAADKILVAPGTIIGSIGVIMEFVNLEKLYEWAHVSRYSITTGKFKDAGAEYRAMRDDEKTYFQDMINEVLQQFKEAVAEGRSLKMDVLDQYADGRIFNGNQAVKIGLADGIGTLQDGFEEAAKLAKIDDNYEIFEPKKPKKFLIDLLSNSEDEEEYFGSLKNRNHIQEVLDKTLKLQLANKPLYLMPGFIN